MPIFYTTSIFTSLFPDSLEISENRPRRALAGWSAWRECNQYHLLRVLYAIAGSVFLVTRTVLHPAFYDHGAWLQQNDASLICIESCFSSALLVHRVCITNRPTTLPLLYIAEVGVRQQESSSSKRIAIFFERLLIRCCVFCDGPSKECSFPSSGGRLHLAVGPRTRGKTESRGTCVRLGILFVLERIETEVTGLCPHSQAQKRCTLRRGHCKADFSEYSPSRSTAEDSKVESQVHARGSCRAPT